MNLKKINRLKKVKKAFNIKRNNTPFIKLRKRMRLERRAKRYSAIQKAQEAADASVPKVG